MQKSLNRLSIGNIFEAEWGEEHLRKEAKMAIAILITRQFKKGEIEIQQANELNLKLRALATVQPGFISGQSMISQDNPHRIIVLSRWASREDWENWIATPIRKTFMEKLENVLESPEQIEVFSF